MTKKILQFFLKIHSNGFSKSAKLSNSAGKGVSNARKELCAGSSLNNGTISPLLVVLRGNASSVKSSGVRLSDDGGVLTWRDERRWLRRERANGGGLGTTAPDAST